MKTLNEILFNPKLSEEDFKDLTYINQEIINYIFNISKSFLADVKKDGKPYCCKWNNHTFQSQDIINVYGQKGKSKEIKELFKYYGVIGLCGRGTMQDTYMEDWTDENGYRLSGFAVAKPSSVVCKEIANMCGFKKVGLKPFGMTGNSFHERKSLITSFKITM